jgi:hypothetical protein
MRIGDAPLTALESLRREDLDVFARARYPPVFRQRPSGRALLIIAIGSILVCSCIIAIRFRVEIRYWLWREDLVAELTVSQDVFFVDEPPPTLERVFAAGDEGYPTLIWLLRHPRQLVWERTALAIDRWHPHAQTPPSDTRLFVATPTLVIDRLRRDDAFALARYLLPPPPADGDSPWRDPYPIDEDGRRGARAYWAGQGGDPLRPGNAAVRWLDKLLSGHLGVREPGDEAKLASRSSDLERLQLRAIEALDATISPGPPPIWPPRGSVRSDREQAIQVLVDVVETHPSGVIREIAADVLGQAFRDYGDCASRCDGVEYPSLRFPFALSVSIGMDIDDGDLDHARHRLSRLALVDDARVLLVLSRLLDDENREPIVRQVLEDPRSPIPVGPLSWLPIADSAERFLTRPDPGQRAVCLLALADSRTTEARATLLRHELRELDPELRLFTRTSLVGHGDLTHLVAVIEALDARLMAWETATHASNFDELADIARDELPHDSIDRRSRPLDTLKIRTRDLAMYLLRAGSREALDRLVAHRIRCGMQSFRLDLAPFVSGPTHDLTLLRLVEATEWRDFDFQRAESERLREWWLKNGARLSWREQQGRFVLP